MRGRWLERAAAGVTLLAAVLFAASALRLAAVALSRALQARASADADPSAAPRPNPVPRRLRAVRTAASASASAGSAGSTKPGKPKAEPARTKLVHVTLVVSAGPARSEVYVRGRRVGHTPYVGEVTCRESTELGIDIVPPRGMPLRFSRRCLAGATLHIEE